MNIVKKLNASKAEDIEQSIVVSMMQTVSNEKYNPIEVLVSIELPDSNESIKPVVDKIK